MSMLMTSEIRDENIMQSEAFFNDHNKGWKNMLDVEPESDSQSNCNINGIIQSQDSEYWQKLN